MLLLLMSMLRKSHFIRINMTPLLITSEDYYKMLDFNDPQIKYIYFDLNPSIFPVNKLNKGEWIFDTTLEKREIPQNISLSAFALFKFLLNSNFIYSAEEIRIQYKNKEENIEEQLNYLLSKYKQYSKLINIKMKFYYSMPNLIILDIKTCIEHQKFNFNDYFHKHDKITESDNFNEIRNQDVDSFILRSETENEVYIFDIQNKFQDLLLYSSISIKEKRFFKLIDISYHKVTFLSYEDIIFNCCITIF